MIERQQVNLRLERELIEQLDDLARADHVDRTEVARRLLVSGVAEARVDRALRDYSEGRVTAWRAATDAGVSLYEMLDRIHERGIPYELDPDVLERLGGESGAKPKTAIAESRASYGSDETTGIDDLRSRYKPRRVRTLFVGESSPAQGTHFYRTNSNLYRAVRSAYAMAQGADAVPNGEAFLRYFADKGGWLVNLAGEPVNRLAGAERRRAIEAGIPNLAQTIRANRPQRIVIVKRDIAAAVGRASHEAGSKATLLTLPFPVRQWRATFERELAEFLRGH